MTTPFTLLWSNPDLDIHPNPPEGFHRVAVVSGWHDAAKARAKWPHAAVVGPLRSVRGIDLLVRGLLANPQIRILVWDGPDLTGTKNLLLSLWFGQEGTELADDIEPHMQGLRDGVKLFWDIDDVDPDSSMSDRKALTCGWLDHDAIHGGTDRPGGPVILPPPPPTVSDTRAAHVTAPRFEADTLAALWPQLLREILDAGRTVPTQSGDTLEVLNMVGVVRDPKKTLARLPAEDSHVYGFNWQDLLNYTDRLMTGAKGEGMDYSYGSLLAGGDPVALANGDEWNEDGRDGLWAFLECAKCPSGTTTFDMAWNFDDLGRLMDGKLYCPRGHRLKRPDLRATAPMTRSGYPPPLLAPDQLAALDEALQRDPLSRAHFLTPWHPSRFSPNDDGGQPCLVGIQFRAVAGDRCPRCGAPFDAAGSCMNRQRGPCQGGRGEAMRVLHVTVTFRSHDYFGAYPQNLAAVCLWLCRLADKRGMEVGTVTCVSVSAHLYDRDWDAARAVVKAYKPPAISWDQRASWRVEKIQGKADVPLMEWADGSPAGPMIKVRTQHLRATAMNPMGEHVLATFEARTPEALARQCVDSGLITEIGAAVWLGREIERVARGDT